MSVNVIQNQTSIFYGVEFFSTLFFLLSLFCSNSVMLTIPFKSPSRLLIPFFLQLLYLVHLQEIVKIPIGVVHRFRYYFIYLLSIFLFCLSDILLSCFIFPAKKQFLLHLKKRQILKLTNETVPLKLR